MTRRGMRRERPGPNRPAGHLLRDAAAPLLLLAALAAGGLATLDVWCAAGLATGTWPALSPALVVALLRDGPAAVLPPGSPSAGSPCCSPPWPGPRPP